MNLATRSAIDPRWQAAAGVVLDGFLNCEIELWDQEMTADASNFNWKTNTGSGGSSTLLFAAPAQLQIFRFTLTMDAPAGSVDQIRSVRFTLDRNLVEGINVRRGQSVRVTSCPSDSTLEHYQYVVNSGINSPSAFRRTIETEVDMTRVIP